MENDPKGSVPQRDLLENAQSENKSILPQLLESGLSGVYVTNHNQPSMEVFSNFHYSSPSRFAMPVSTSTVHQAIPSINANRVPMLTGYGVYKPIGPTISTSSTGQNTKERSGVVDISSDSDEEAQDLTVAKVPQESPSGVEQEGQANCHKKLNYKKWTTGKEKDATKMSAGTSEQQPSTSKVEDIDQMLSELHLSQFITREQAKSRLLALGSKEEVQREIDAFAAIIQCGNAARSMNQNAASPPDLPTGGRASARTMPYQLGARGNARPQVESEQSNQDRETVIKQRMPQ